MTAAYTVLPVLGVPVTKNKALERDVILYFHCPDAYGYFTRFATFAIGCGRCSKRRVVCGGIAIGHAPP
jgi:hypothetical protein